MLPGPWHHPASNQTLEADPAQTLLPWQPLGITKEMGHSILPLSLTILIDPLTSTPKAPLVVVQPSGKKKMLFPLSKSDTRLHRSLAAQREIPGIIPHYPLGKIKRTQTTAARLEALDGTQGTFA